MKVVEAASPHPAWVVVVIVSHVLDVLCDLRILTGAQRLHTTRVSSLLSRGQFTFVEGPDKLRVGGLRAQVGLALNLVWSKNLLDRARGNMAVRQFRNKRGRLASLLKHTQNRDHHVLAIPALPVRSRQVP
jgi:hypothetical protein